MREVLKTGHDVFSELKNLCVWNKTNGGMGSFHRSKIQYLDAMTTHCHANAPSIAERSGRPCRRSIDAP